MAAVMKALLTLLVLSVNGVWAQTRDGDSQTRESPREGILTRCYNNWGCFSIGEPFFSPARPVSLYPMNPDQLNINFLLLNRRAPDQFEKLVNHRNGSFSNFEVGRTVKLIIHGYLEEGYQEWIKEMSRELLTAEDTNVIAVDWKLGAMGPYPQAVANARAAGLVVADFIEFLQRLYRVLPSDIHIIGHNLGAHVAGYAGERIPRLSRISGLDPAGPYFQDTDPRVRLDPSDAAFVDVIHTPGSGNFLVPVMQQESGHVDFYPSGGWRRPVCDAALSETSNVAHCTSVRGYQLFTESINTDCPFDGFICDNYGNFSAGKCADGCGPDLSKCASLGYRSQDWQRFAQGTPVRMFLETDISEAYCRFHYHVNMVSQDAEIAGRSVNETGTMFVRLVGTKGKTPLLQASRSLMQFGPGKTTEFVVSSPNLGRLLRLDLVWTPLSTPYTPNSYLPRIPRISVHNFKVTNLETNYREIFCSNGEPIDPQSLKTFFAGGIC